jgi:hypothetical protein
MSSSVADIYALAKLVLDSGDFVAQAGSAGDKGGQAAGDRMSAQLNSKLKKAISGAVGAGAGLVTGVMLSQGQALDAATQKLAADTGLTGQALAQEGASIDNLYKHSLQSMGDVEHALSIEISAYKLTGQAAETAALGVVKYEEATGQGSEAIDTLKEITDAYNLSASDQGHVMDLLVASHQQYSTNVGESQAALLAMGPSLSAMNMGLDDGVALLNLFETAGISASKAPAALNKAIKTLKPGQDLNDLITQISSIVDPTERAQAAMQIFGAKGGTNLAKAFAPGITSLNEYKTSAESTVGASNKAAQAIEDDWGNRATLALHQAGGALASIGEQFGPLLSAAAIAGPGLTKAIASGIGGAAGLLAPAITKAILGTTTTAAAAAGTVGTAAGTAESEAELAAKQALAPEDAAAAAATKAPIEAAAAAGVGTIAGEAEVQGEALAVAAGGPEVGAAIAAQAPEAAAAGGAVGTAVGTAMAVAIPVAVGAALVVAAEKGGDLWGQIVDNIFGNHLIGDLKNNGLVVPKPAGPSMDPGEQAAAIKAATEATHAAALADKDAAQKAVEDGLTATEQWMISSGMAQLEKAADGTFQVIPISAADQWAAANVNTRVGLAEIVSQIKASGASMASAWSTAMSERVSAQTIGYRLESNAADIADNAKQIADKKTWATLTQQQKDSLLEQRAQLQADHIALLVEDTQYGTKAQRQAKLTALLQSQALKDGLSSTNPDIRAMWADVQGQTETSLGILSDDVEQFAKDTGLSLADAWDTKQIDDAITAAAAHWLSLLPPGFSYDWNLGHVIGAPQTPTILSTGSASGPPGQLPLQPPAGTIKHNPAGFASGTPFVAYDQLAYIHRGEAIIPAAQNKGGMGNSYNFTGPVSFGSDVSPEAARRFIRSMDDLADKLQTEASRFSGYTGSRP